MVAAALWIAPIQKVALTMFEATQPLSVASSISASAPSVQAAHADCAVERDTDAVHFTQQWLPHSILVAVPPAQFTPSVIHGNGIASTIASTIASGGGAGCASTGGGSCSAQLPSTHCWDSGHCSDRWHGAPS